VGRRRVWKNERSASAIEGARVSFEKDLAGNRSAFHNYFITDKVEAGIVLVGTEVKSLRVGACNLKDAYARVKDGEVFLYNCHISPYSHGNIFNHEPLRPRKLLLHRRQILRLERDQTTTGQTLIPLRIYLKDGVIKVELGVAKGKKQHDKREAKRLQTLTREAAQAMRERSKGR
jgi:SsrA-binding protein